MREIIIKAANYRRLMAALDSACLTTCEYDSARIFKPMLADIVDRARRVEGYLSIPAEALEGTEIDVDEYAKSSLRIYSLYTTQYKMRYHRGKWRLTDVYRAEIRHAKNKVRITLSETAKAALLEKYSRMN